MSDEDWPKAPIWPEDLPLIRELLTDEEFEKAAQQDGSSPPSRTTPSRKAPTTF